MNMILKALVAQLVSEAHSVVVDRQKRLDFEKQIEKALETAIALLPDGSKLEDACKAALQALRTVEKAEGGVPDET